MIKSESKELLIAILAKHTSETKQKKTKHLIYWSSFSYMTRIIAMSTFPETFVLIKAILRKPDGKKISKNGVYIDIDLYRTCLHFLSRRIYDFILICSSITLFISPRSSVGGNCFFFKNLQTRWSSLQQNMRNVRYQLLTIIFVFP